MGQTHQEIGVCVSLTDRWRTQDDAKVVFALLQLEAQPLGYLGCSTVEIVHLAPGFGDDPRPYVPERTLR